VQYVWLSPNHWRRIPFAWGTSQWAWFTAHFTQVVPKNPNDWIRGIGNLYVRKS
jgi:hypothetical protein